MPTYDIDDFVPHSGKMSLLDDIIDYGEDWLHAQVKIHQGSMFLERKGVSAIIGIEYLAQAVAAYSGTKQHELQLQPKLGLLLGIRSYRCSVDYFPVGSTLSIEVELEMEADNGLSVFNGVIKGHGFEAITRLNVFEPSNAKEFLKGVM